MAKSLCSPFFHFSVNQLTIRHGERERKSERELGRDTVKVHWAFESGLNVTSGACSTWWEVIFWCKSGRIRSKRRDSQSINRQIRHGNCRLWLFPAHRIPLSALKLFILSKGKERREEKSSEVGLSLPCLCKRSYAHGSNTHKAPLCTPRAHSFIKTAFICCGLYSYKSNVGASKDLWTTGEQ